MAISLPRTKRIGTVLAVALLLVTAGCSGASPDGTPTNVTDTTQTTAPPTTTATDTTTTSTTQTTEDAPRTVAASGEMAVVVDDQRIDLSRAVRENQSASFWVEDANGTAQWQRTEADVTLAEGLARAGVNVTGDSVSYDGTTYRESASNTSVAVRVNGESVDPSEYVLQQGDEVWVVVITHPLDQPVPGDHISHDDLHVHGHINMTVDGHSVDFSRAKYKTPGHNQHFHFEGSSAPLWHAHSWSVTLKYAMGTLPGISVTENSVTYDNTTYRRSDQGTTLTIEVNGEPVDPSTYVLKDGDQVTIEVSTNGSN